VDDQLETRARGVKRLLAFVGSMIVVCTFALLIWAKLRMVTGVPRTAYADPNGQTQSAPDQPVDGTKAKPPRKPARSAAREEMIKEQRAAAAKTEQQVKDAAPVVESGGK
jgi:hypothetical protein